MKLTWKKGAVICVEMQRAEAFNIIEGLEIILGMVALDRVRARRVADLHEEFEEAVRSLRYSESDR